MVDVARERFEELVRDALDEVPVELTALMSNVVVLVEDEPPGSDPGLLGLYEGIALTERDSWYSGVLPDGITLFRIPLCRACDTEQQVIDEVAVTIVHEIAHHFGIEEERLHELGWG
ncbi:MAG: metallopeptidase family protein [Jatrophihabitantaceae bacterium]